MGSMAWAEKHVKHKFVYVKEEDEGKAKEIFRDKYVGWNKTWSKVFH